MSAPDLLDTRDAGGAAIRGGALQVIGYLTGTALAVVPSALLLRHLGVVRAGDYVTVLSLVTLAGGVTEAGLAAVGVRELSTLSTGRVRTFFANLVGLRLVFAVAGALIATGLAAVSGYATTLILGTLLASVGQVLTSTQQTYMLPLLAQLRFRSATVVNVLRQFGTTAAIVTLVLLGAPLLPFFGATIPAGIATAVLGAVLIRKTMPLRPAFDAAVWRPVVRGTLPYSLATAVGIVYFRLAILIMSHVASGQQTGYYGASFRIIEFVFVVPQLLIGSALPIFARAARDDHERLSYALGRTFDVCLLLGLATGVFLITGSNFIIAVIAGPKFAPAADVLRIQGFALISTFTGAVFGYGLLSMGRYREMLVLNLVVLSLSGVLTAILGSTHGAIGAASATALVEMLYTAMLAVAVVRAGVRPKVSFGGMSRALLAALLGALALVPAGLPNVARPVLALSIYGATLLVLGAIPAEVLEQLSRIRRRLPTMLG